MTSEARETGGLGPASERPPLGRSRWGRRPPDHSSFSDETAHASGGPVYAALDLGTNNCRLLVARPTDDSFRVVDAFSRIIRLGEGLSQTGRIGEAAIQRAVVALSICRDKMHVRGVSRARLIATEACRAAENGQTFRSRIAEEVGLELEVVDRETEAALAATGCAPLVAPEADGVILFDIGGGSSELVMLGRTVANGCGPASSEIKAWTSIPIGVVTLAERHGGVTVSPAVYEAMVREVAAHVTPFADAQGNGNLDRIHLLGTSGTVTTIAGVHLRLPRYDRRRIDGVWLSRRQISDVVDRLLGMRYEDRVANPCIGAERADLVLAGCAILEAIRRSFPCTRLRVADRGLREGMLVQMMREDHVWNTQAGSAP
ncbi:MAG: Ppx/GppA family phosphatase [Rhizobiales bacterium]|nr:Ppx/GppA family phosphatase [Hyphomicrobiales bacterium]